MDQFLSENTINITILIFLVLHELLMGRWWVWNIFSVIPPLLFPLLFFFLLGWNLWTGNLTGLIFVLLSLPFLWRNSDIILKRDTLAKKIGMKQITVFNWNTEHWETEATLSAFYAFMRSQDADIYQLQERMNPAHVPYEDRQELERVFAGYHIAEKNELLTMSPYPIVKTFPGQEQYFRVDIDLEGTIVSFYNVHIHPQLMPVHLRHPAFFVSELRRRFYNRKNHFALLEEDVRNNPHPCFVSGDFNATTVMKQMRPLQRLTRDAVRASRTVFPATWEYHGIRLWRLDWNLLKGRIEALTYENIWAREFSDHAGQKVTFSLWRSTPLCPASPAGYAEASDCHNVSASRRSSEERSRMERPEFLSVSQKSSVTKKKFSDPLEPGIGAS